MEYDITKNMVRLSCNIYLSRTLKLEKDVHKMKMISRTAKLMLKELKAK